jgi:RNA polymerase sigma factor (sigma-70 family)
VGIAAIASGEASTRRGRSELSLVRGARNLGGELGRRLQACEPEAAPSIPAWLASGVDHVQRALASEPSSSQPEASTARLMAVTEPDDVGDLIRRFQEGDRTAFTEIFRRYRVDVARFVFRMLGPTADAEDVVQEVFIQVHRSLGDFRGQSKFTTWLHRVTVNVVLMTRRAARSRPVFSDELPADVVADRGELPDDDVARRRRIDAFRRLIAQLPEKKRTVYVLHELEGMLPVEIAEVVGAPVLTVRTRLFYARREIEELMRGEPVLAQLAAELAAGNTGKTAANPSKRAQQGASDVPVAGCFVETKAFADTEDM